MTIRRRFLQALAFVWAVSFVGQTAAAEDEKKLGWSGKAGFGYLASSGNSDSSAVNATLDLFYDLERWHHSLKLLGTGTSTEGDTSGERYTADLKTDWDRTEKDYEFGLVSYEKDNDSGVREKLSETLGYGRHVLATDRHVLNLEAGVGFQQIDFQDGTDDSSAIARLGGDYKFLFSETATFDSALAIEIGADNTYTVWGNSVTAKLADTLDLNVGYEIKYNTDVPAGTDDTDTYTSITIQYGF